jgi:aspartate aminotransferase
MWHSIQIFCEFDVDILSFFFRATFVGSCKLKDSAMTTNNTLLAPRMSAVKESPTAAVSAKARELAAQGRDIINLGEGELDFGTPDHVSEAGIEAIRSGQTRYTDVAGTPELKAAVQKKFKEENGLGYELDQIISGTGAKQIIFNALIATVSEGDEVLIPVPSWVSYPDIARIAGGNPVFIDCPNEQGFKLRAEDLEKAISPKTKWLILNSPNNPTGAVYTAEEMKALTDVLLRYPQLLVLADDIYEHIVYEGRACSPAQIEPRLIDRTLTVNGVSKVFSMTGWRLGYAGGPAWLIRAIEILQSQSTTNASSISQYAAVAALEGSLDFFAPRLNSLRRRRDRVMQALQESNDRLSAAVPDGAFYVYADCSGMIGAKTPQGQTISTDVDAAAYFLESAGLAMVPGAAFGMSPFLRIAFAVDDDLVEKACDGLVLACKSLS